MDVNKRSSVSNVTTVEEMGEFWDTHDFTDYDQGGPDIEFTLSHTVQIEAELFTLLEQEAQQRGVTVETLVNLWLQQRLAGEASSRAA